MLVKVRYVLCLGFVWIFSYGVVLCKFVMSCVCMAHDACVMLGFLAFCYILIRRRRLSCFYFITTMLAIQSLQEEYSHPIFLGRCCIIIYCSDVVFNFSDGRAKRGWLCEMSCKDGWRAPSLVVIPPWCVFFLRYSHASLAVVRDPTPSIRGVSMSWHSV